MHIQFLHSEELIIDPWHPVCKNGAAVLRIVGTGRIIDPDILRADPNSKIITDAPQLVCMLLGIQYPDRQIKARKRRPRGTAPPHCFPD